MKQHPMARFAKRFLKNEDGNVLMLFGLSVLFLVGIGGSAIDLGLQQLMRTKFQGSADAAATSAASLTVPNGTVSSTDRINAAHRYFNLNYPSQFYNIARPTPVVNLTSTDITVSAVGQVRTSFVTHFGIPTLPADGASTVSLASQSVSDYDVVMVVDETGSTVCAITWPNAPLGNCPRNSQRINAMRAALTTMANNIVPVGNSNPNVRIGFIGYASHIMNKWGVSSNNAHALTAISNLRPTSNNYDHLGMQAALNMINGGNAGVANQQITTPPVQVVTSNITVPQPRTARTQPSDPRGMSPVKYVVLLTDGDIMTDAPPCADPFDGRPNPPFPICYAGYSPQSRNYTPFLTACTALKNAGAHVYVLDFATAPAGAETAMRTCASTNLATGQPDFYFAPDAATLNSLLQNIATEIRRVRIIQ